MDTIQKIQKHYEELFCRHGDSPQACQWTDRNSQDFRFEQLVSIADLHDKKILDIGCGLGDFYQYLCDHQINVEYTGIDLVESMIEVAKRKYPKANFSKMNLFLEPINEKYDYVFMSGVFSSMCEGDEQVNLANMEKMLSIAFDACTCAMGFNFISSYVNFKVGEMTYYSPEDVFTFCVRNLSRKVRLFHHYERCDVAVFVYK